jgi:hypothetical protein
MYKVTELIKNEDLWLIGCYTQTCAHIEHVLWAYYFFDHPVSASDEAEKKRIMDLRLNTRSLIEALALHSDSLCEEESLLLQGVLAEIKDGLQARHSIIHGAIAYDGATDGYFLFHHRKPNRKVSEYIRYEGALEISMLREALQIADDILRRAIDLYARAERRAADRSG